MECRARLDGRYPFFGSAADLSLSDLADLFGPSGLYDKFFIDHLEKMVDRTQRPWVWRADAVQPSAGMLAQFERADQIRRIFFGVGGRTPKVSVVVAASGLDASASRLFLSLEGQSLAIRPGEHLERVVEWPGAQGGGSAFATFEDTIAAPVRVHQLSGPWALFRFVDATAPPSATSERQTSLQVESPQHKARVTIEAQNPTSDPFVSGDWRRFRCES